MIKRNGLIVIAVSVIFLTLLLAASGCTLPVTTSNEEIIGPTKDAEMSDASKLYVDAVTLNIGNEKLKAIDKLNKAVELAPDFVLAFSLRGEIYREMQKYAESADSYESATKIDPYSFKDFLNLAKVAQIAGDFNRAVKAYIEACELKPENIEANLGAAKCYFELKEYENALEYGHRAKEIDASGFAADIILAGVYAATGYHDSAIISYKRALELGGNNPEVMVPMAVAYIKTSRFSAAEELLTGAIEIDRSNGPAYQYLGFVYLKFGRYDDAVQSYMKAITIDSRDWEARRGLGVVYMMQSKANKDDPVLRAKGLAEWEQSLLINPDQPGLQGLYKKYSHGQ